MSVQIEPEKFLTFQRPLIRTVEEILTIKNPHSTPVAFKVKTTAPKQYCVRPNSGIVDPESTREVLVMLQAFKEEPESDYRCKDKFLVQTVMVPADKQLLAVNDLWSQMEATDAASIKQHKLKCEFLPANTPEVEEPSVNGVHATTEQYIRQRSSPAPAASESTLQNDYDSTQNEVLQMKEKLQEYERELSNIRSLKEPSDQLVQSQQQGYPIQVLVMVAIAVFAMSYAIFGAKQ
ncbi:PapD-like protein [Phascolomyces articulosus]|uniref:PapD-like protein n=1 Tax=Phascolomyces articulosus TaxID=60185 RepID=A0AAD5JX24_9FUNG|nr:PapD-like protein [Phascolomyces articulosus]